jgi:hypothetical protein
MAGPPLKRWVLIDGDGATLVHAPTRVAALHTYESHRAKNGPEPVSRSKPMPLEPISIYELGEEIRGAT